MDNVNNSIKPPLNLSIYYLLPENRPLLNLLLSFDSKINQIYSNINEIIMAQIRLAWWRDTIASDNKPKGEPLILLIEEAQRQYHHIDLGHILTKMINGWEVLITATDDMDDDAMTEFAQNTGGLLFKTIAIQSCAHSLDDNLIDQFYKLGSIWSLSKLYDEPRFAEKSRKLSHILSQDLNLKKCASELRALTIIAYSPLYRLANPDKNPPNEGFSYGISFILHAMIGRWGFKL